MVHLWASFTYMSVFTMIVDGDEIHYYDNFKKNIQGFDPIYQYCCKFMYDTDKIKDVMFDIHDNMIRTATAIYEVPDMVIDDIGDGRFFDIHTDKLIFMAHNYCKTIDVSFRGHGGNWFCQYRNFISFFDIFMDAYMATRSLDDPITFKSINIDPYRKGFHTRYWYDTRDR